MKNTKRIEELEKEIKFIKMHLDSINKKIKCISEGGHYWYESPVCDNQYLCSKCCFEASLREAGKTGPICSGTVEDLRKAIKKIKP